MELKEIRNLVLEILNDIEKNKYNYTYRKYETVFEQFGMLKRRDFKILKRIEKQFKNKNITFWQGKEQIKNLADFSKNSTITFKINTMENLTENGKTAKVNFAGKVNISKSESGIRPYKHQEEAFYNLQKQIIKSEKNPVAGLLVLPTGRGKTLTAGLWIAKNF